MQIETQVMESFRRKLFKDAGCCSGNYMAMILAMYVIIILVLEQVAADTRPVRFPESELWEASYLPSVNCRLPISGGPSGGQE